MFFVEGYKNKEAAEERYQEAMQRYLGWCAVNNCEAFEAAGELSNADPFAHARLIAEEGITDRTREYIIKQNGTRTLESIQQPFKVTITLEFDGKDFLLQSGLPMLPSMRKSILTAHALRQVDERMDFFVRRTIHEFTAKQDEIKMMQNAPNGAVIGLFSPCETADPKAAKEVGMFPARDMGVVQLSRKRDAQTMDIVTFSFDRFSEVVRHMAADQAIDLPADCRNEDMLGYRFRFHTETLGDLQAYAEELIAKADARLEGATRQGQPDFNGKDTARAFWEECIPVQQEQLRFDAAISQAAGREPLPLHPLLRHDAQAALQAVLEDGRPLLNMRERAAVGALLTAERVHIDNETHRFALHTLKKVHETGIDEVVRLYMNGQAGAFLSLPDPQRGSGGNASAGAGSRFMAVTKIAVQENRFAAGCGSDSRFGEESMRREKSFVSLSGGKTSGEMIQAWIFSGFEYLQRKYGRELLKYKTCRSCDAADWCGPCHCCATCDRKDSAKPGYIMRKLQSKRQKQPAAA